MSDKKHLTTENLTLELVRSQIPKHMHNKVDEGTLNEIKKLIDDPEYGHEFLDNYIDHLNILKQMPTTTPERYLKAVKFFGLVEAGNTLKDAYMKTFPERVKERQANCPDTWQNSIEVESSRFNRSKIVNELRRVSAIPVQLIHRHLLHEAILEQAQLMRNARSDMVRQKASEVLIRELKPSEDQVLNINVNDDAATSVIEELRKATEALAIQERKAIQSGAASLKDVAESKIIDVTPNSSVEFSDE